MMLIAVHQELHWSLCVVVNPSAILPKQHGQNHDMQTILDEPPPCILHLDSFCSHPTSTIGRRIREWLNFEWDRLHGSKEERWYPYTKDNMKITRPDFPRQPNGVDCGVYVCRYASGLVSIFAPESGHVPVSPPADPPETATDPTAQFAETLTKRSELMFDHNEVVRIREDMKTLVWRLHESYVQIRTDARSPKRRRQQHSIDK